MHQKLYPTNDVTKTSIFSEMFSTPPPRVRSIQSIGLKGEKEGAKKGEGGVLY